MELRKCSRGKAVALLLGLILLVSLPAAVTAGGIHDETSGVIDRTDGDRETDERPSPAETTASNANSPGDLEWVFEDPSDRVLSPPTVVDGTAYIGSRDGSLYAVDAENGDGRWEFDEPEDEIETAPAVYEGTVYVGAEDGGLYAVDAETGRQEWVFTETGGTIYSSPTAYDGTVYLSGIDGTLYAIDAETGQQEWTYTEPDAGLSAPTIYDGVIYVSSGETLYAVDAETGAHEWAFTEPTDYIQQAPTVADGTVYVGADDKTLYAVDATNGTQEWAYTQPSDYNSHGSPTVADGIVYAAFQYELHAVDAETGQQEWSAFSTNSIRSDPTVADGTVYLGRGPSEDMMAYDADTGHPEWSFDEFDGWVRSTPIVVDGTVYIGADDELYAITASGDGNSSSDGSRVDLGTTGHHHSWTGEPRSSIAGVVTDQRDEPVSDVQVTLRDPETERELATVRTDDRGQWETEPVVERSSVLVETDVYGYEPYSESLETGGDRLEIELADAASTVDGRVVDDDGEAIADATIAIGDDETTTDANGEYELTVREGPHTLTATADGYESTTTEIATTATEPTTVDVTLNESASDGGSGGDSTSDQSSDDDSNAQTDGTDEIGESDDPEDTDSSDDGVPGFGPLVALLAILGLGGTRAYRRG